jgi:hypothetical protein
MRRLIGRLTQLCCIVGLLAMFSYAVGLHSVVRMKAPAAGAWWNAHEFYFMEGAATALGLLVALRVGVRFAAVAASIRYLAPVALALEAALLLPLTRLCARVARFGADGGAIVAPNRMAAYAGFESGKKLGTFKTPIICSSLNRARFMSAFLSGRLLRLVLLSVTGLL